jgi:hypothetical protein
MFTCPVAGWKHPLFGCPLEMNTNRPSQSRAASRESYWGVRMPLAFYRQCHRQFSTHSSEGIVLPQSSNGCPELNCHFIVTCMPRRPLLFVLPSMSLSERFKIVDNTV